MRCFSSLAGQRSAARYALLHEAAGGNRNLPRTRKWLWSEGWDLPLQVSLGSRCGFIYWLFLSHTSLKPRVSKVLLGRKKNIKKKDTTKIQFFYRRTKAWNVSCWGCVSFLLWGSVGEPFSIRPWLSAAQVCCQRWWDRARLEHAPFHFQHVRLNVTNLFWETWLVRTSRRRRSCSELAVVRARGTNPSSHHSQLFARCSESPNRTGERSVCVQWETSYFVTQRV